MVWFISLLVRLLIRDLPASSVKRKGIVRGESFVPPPPECRLVKVNGGKWWYFGICHNQRNEVIKVILSMILTSAHITSSYISRPSTLVRTGSAK